MAQMKIDMPQTVPNNMAAMIVQKYVIFPRFDFLSGGMFMADTFMSGRCAETK